MRECGGRRRHERLEPACRGEQVPCSAVVPHDLEPDGQTEILISQAYRWAFGPGRGQRYGYAAAYAVVIFLLLWAQSRLSRRLTEIDA